MLQGIRLVCGIFETSSTITIQYFKLELRIVRDLVGSKFPSTLTTSKQLYFITNHGTEQKVYRPINHGQGTNNESN